MYYFNLYKYYVLIIHIIMLYNYSNCSTDYIGCCCMDFEEEDQKTKGT